MKKGLNTIDLFSGAGGLSCGFEQAGFNILLGTDNNKTALETFKLNHPDSKILLGDISEISTKDILKTIDHQKIDVIIGGPPCQGFSLAGDRDPKDPRNSLFKEYLRIVKEIKPKVFIMENVRGILSMKNDSGQKVIDIILGEFKKLSDYNVEIFQVNSADYGVPQRRKRMFLIGISKGHKFQFPHPTHSETGFSPDGKKIKKWIGVKNILKTKSQIDKKYFYSKKLISGFLRREKENSKKGIGFGWQFLREDYPSFTISARYYKDGAEALIRYNNTYKEGSIRKLTWQECALIQSFPKNFIFSGNERDIYNQIGNAVPPKMAKIIALSLQAVL